MIWKHSPNLETIKSFSKNTLADHLGIEYLEFSDDSITARMPVDHRTHQPMGILHGGASVALAETLGSIASVFCLDDPMALTPVGLNISADHLRPISQGFVIGTVKPIKIGQKVHLWEILIKNEKGQLICHSKLTCMIIPRSKS